MNFRLLSFVIILNILIGCGDDNEAQPVEPVVEAYDTLELRYQQLADIAVELISNVSGDADIKTTEVQDMLDRQPVVSLDFRKPLTTRKDIVSFISYQKKIDQVVEGVFSQLESAPKWRAAPLVIDYKSRYNTMKDSIRIATAKFNAAVKEANLTISIPMDSSSKKHTAK